jgi:SsrA-binding protein
MSPQVIALFGVIIQESASVELKVTVESEEITHITQKLKDKGFTIIPLKIYFNERGFAKIQIGLAKGKKLHDKRESVKQRESEREIKRYLG